MASLSNTRGLQATVMACAAFCIPTSMTMVRRSAPVRRKMRESREPPLIARRMSTVIQSPRDGNSCMMVALCWRKNTVARRMRAGNAPRFSMLWMRLAAVVHFIPTPSPMRMGTAISTMFCMSRLPTGRCTSAPVPMEVVNHAIMSGTVKSVMMELQAVKVTESATSPRASMEKTLLELPPGLHAMSMMPKKKKGVRWKIEPTTQAMRGRRMICPMTPAKTGRGRWRMRRKS